MARKKEAIQIDTDKFCKDRSLGWSLRDVAIANDFSPNKLEKMLYQGEKDLDIDADTPLRKFFVEWHRATIAKRDTLFAKAQTKDQYGLFTSMLSEEEESNKAIINAVLLEHIERLNNND